MTAFTYFKDQWTPIIDDYLAKPINKDELNRIINKYLNND